MKNFRIDRNISLSVQGGEFKDIHNQFALSNVIFDFISHRVKYVLTPRTGEHSELIELDFSEVLFFQFTENPFTQYSEEIDEFGYKAVGDDDTEWVLSECEYEEGMHFVLRSTNGTCLRIGAEKMIARILDARAAS